MDQIGIIGKPTRRRFQIVNSLEGTHAYRVRIFSKLDEVKQFLKDSMLSGLLFVEEKFQDSHIELMDSISNEFPDLLILCLVTQINSSQREEFQRYSIPRCVVLDFNHELKDLKGVVQRMIRGESVSLRSHYRFTVSKRAQLFSPSGSVEQIQIVDISAGGLQAKVGRVEGKIGEKIQIKVPKDNGNGSHMIIGKVAWISKKGTFGVKFDQVISKSHPNPFFASA